MAKLRFEPTCTQNSDWGLVIQTPEYLHLNQLGRVWNHLEGKPLGMFEGIFSRANKGGRVFLECGQRHSLGWYLRANKLETAT